MQDDGGDECRQAAISPETTASLRTSHEACNSNTGRGLSIRPAKANLQTPLLWFYNLGGYLLQLLLLRCAWLKNSLIINNQLPIERRQVSVWGSPVALSRASCSQLTGRRITPSIFLITHDTLNRFVVQINRTLSFNGFVPVIFSFFGIVFEFFEPSLALSGIQVHVARFNAGGILS